MTYRCVTLPGVVIGHKVRDLRSRLTKWLDAKLPSSISRFFGLQNGLHYLVQVHIDDEAYAVANGRLEVEYACGTDRRIGNNKNYEVKKDDFTSRYAIDTRVSVTYSMSSTVDQYFIGTMAIDWELRPLESEENFLKMPGAILPGQRLHFFA